MPLVNANASSSVTEASPEINIIGSAIGICDAGFQRGIAIAAVDVVYTDDIGNEQRLEFALFQNPHEVPPFFQARIVHG